MKQVEDVLEQYKKQREQIEAMGIPHKLITYGNSRSSELGTIPVNGTPSRDTRSDMSVEGTVFDHA